MEDLINNIPCEHCDAPMDRNSNFCSFCGKPTTRHLMERQAAQLKEAKKTRNEVFSIATAFIGVLICLVILSKSDTQSWDWSARMLVENGLLVMSGFAALFFLGQNAFKESLGRAPDSRNQLMGTLSGFLIYGVGWLYFLLLTSPLEKAPAPFAGHSLPLLAMEMALFPALVEEWLCRGVLWTACSRIVPVKAVLTITSVLFAMLHIPLHGFMGVPFFFIMGMVIGYLRWRSRSLVPGIFAHLINNLLVIIVSIY